MNNESKSDMVAETIADPAAPVTVTAESLDGCQAELAEVKGRLLRALADQENFRRRVEREREDAVRFAAAQLVKDLLPTADSLSRALGNAPAGDDPLQNLLAGVAATERALRDAFVKHGIQKIQPAPGEPFDPQRHQALFEVEGGDCPLAPSPRSCCPVTPITNACSDRHWLASPRVAAQRHQKSRGDPTSLEAL